MWKNIVKGGSPQLTVWRMRIACWISKATITLTICNTHCFSITTMVTRTGLNVTLHVHCLSCCVTLQLIVDLFKSRGSLRVSELRKKDPVIYLFI